MLEEYILSKNKFVFKSSDKVQMEWVVYCIHEHVDHCLSPLKRQIYLLCTFTNSTNFRHFPGLPMLLGHFFKMYLNLIQIDLNISAVMHFYRQYKFQTFSRPTHMLLSHVYFRNIIYK